jgi:hypothetical protein
LEETVMADTDVALLKDRLDVADSIYRYASCIDRRDMAGLRRILADDMWAKYGNSDPMTGGDTVRDWIDSATKDTLWQHHLLSVYHTDIEGDHAKALVYHTSYQTFRDDPDTVRVLVARYHNELKRGSGVWQISRLVFEILWGEKRTDSAGLLASVGGRGPLEIPG